MSESLSRREALKTTAKVAGVAAFATPTVVSMFSTRAAAADQCNPATDSYVIPATNLTNNVTWNQNCANETLGRYNGQNFTAKLSNNDTVIVQIGTGGTDNNTVDCSYYTILSTKYKCTAKFALLNCPDPNNQPSTDCTGAWPPGAQPVPWCHSCPQDTAPSQGATGNKLLLISLNCCPI